MGGEEWMEGSVHTAKKRTTNCVLTGSASCLNITLSTTVLALPECAAFRRWQHSCLRAAFRVCRLQNMRAHLIKLPNPSLLRTCATATEAELKPRQPGSWVVVRESKAHGAPASTVSLNLSVGA